MCIITGAFHFVAGMQVINSVMESYKVDWCMKFKQTLDRGETASGLCSLFMPWSQISRLVIFLVYHFKPQTLSLVFGRTENEHAVTRLRLIGSFHLTIGVWKSSLYILFHSVTTASLGGRGSKHTLTTEMTVSTSGGEWFRPHLSFQWLSVMFYFLCYY